MKQIQKVSIANISFSLDKDAYVSLKQYIDSLHAYYDQDPDGSEIIADIEARIAELILNEQVYTKVVSKQLIDSIVMQLGMPEEIDDAADQYAGTAQAADTAIPRRLYRRREGRVLGGVCSGMAHFWDLNVAWLRLVFLAPMILFIIAAPFDWNVIRDFALGCSWVFIVIYVVLWFAIPLAKSPRQKLEARGEKITPSSIRQNLQERAYTPSAKKAASVMAEILAVTGRVLLFCIKLVVAIIGFGLLTAAIAMLVAMIVAFINPAAIGFLSFMPLTGFAIIPPMVFLSLVIMCMVIPLLILGITFLGIVFTWKPGKLFYFTAFGIWLLIVIFCSIVAANNLRYLENGFRIPRSISEWVSVRDLDDSRILKIREFLDRENNGMNNITINIAGDSLEIVSWRGNPADTLIGADSLAPVVYNKRIVIKEPQIKRRGRIQEGRVEIRRVE